MNKAAFYTGNKSFEVKQASKEKPAEGMVQLKVSYCGVCGTDVHIYHGDMDQRVNMPQTIGHEVSAEVAALGNNVDNVRVGDHVVVRPLQPGEEHPSDKGQNHIGKNLDFIGIDTPGGMQQYWNVPAHTLHVLPDSLPLDIAALIEPLSVACHDVAMSEIRAGQTAVVLGGGPIGVLVALVARHKKANVLLAEPNKKRRSIAKSLGLDTADPTKEGFVAVVEDFSNDAMADVVFEVSGAGSAVSTMTDLLCARGKIVLVAIHNQPREIDLFQFFWRELRLFGARVYEAKDFEEAIKLADSGALPLEQLITQISPLEDIQTVFETIDENPTGIKYLLNIQV